MSDVLELVGVCVVRNGRSLLDTVKWSVCDGERWVMLGPNGAGKTTLLQVASTYLYPTSGDVHVLGERLGAVDICDLRPRMGLPSARLADQPARRERARDVVLTASYGFTGRWRERYEEGDVDRALALLDQWGVFGLAERTFGTLSEG